MKRFTPIIEALSFVVILVAISVMVGWLIGNDTLKSIHSGWVSMKFTTSLAFSFSALITLSLHHYLKNESDFFQILLSVSSLIVSLLMFTMLVSAFFNIQSGIEELFVREVPGGAYTPVPGRPAIMSILNFILISSNGFIALIRPKFLAYWLIGAGSLLLMSGLLAFLGYLSNIPILYYSIPGFSSAIAIHSAFLFALLGLQIILSGAPLAHSPLRKK